MFFCSSTSFNSFAGTSRSKVFASDDFSDDVMTDPNVREEDIFTAEERQKLHQRTIDIRIANEKYLRGHPEVNLVLGEAVRLLLIHRPDEPVAFLEDFLATQDLKALANRLSDEVAKQTLNQ